MNQEELLEFIRAEVPRDKLLLASKEDLVEFLRLEQGIRRQFEKEVHRLRALNDELAQQNLLLGDQYISINAPAQALLGHKMQAQFAPRTRMQA